MEDQVLYSYLAGLFDGEGSVMLMKRHSSDIFKLPTLSMTSTTYELLAICKSTFGGSIRRQKVSQAHYKPSWIWTCRYNRALNAISKLLPFIREPEKYRKMNLLLNRYKLVTIRNGKYTEDQKQAKLQLEHDFYPS